MISEIIAIAAKEPWSIGSELLWMGSDDVICLNGKNPNDIDDDSFAYEDFAIERFGSGYQFCKTDRKPYDTVVVASLIAAEVIALRGGTSIQLSSDGDLKDWAEGIKLFEACFPGLLTTSDVRLSGDRLECTENSIAKPTGIQRGQLRIWFVNQMQSDGTFYYNVESIAEGERLLEVLMAYSVYLSDRDVCMGSGFQEFVGDDEDAKQIGNKYGWISIARK